MVEFFLLSTKQELRPGVVPLDSSLSFFASSIHILTRADGDLQAVEMNGAHSNVCGFEGIKS